MNLYILVEGAETELQLYPKWLSYLIPELKQVHHFKAITQNSYYMLSGGGIPSIYNHAVNAIKDINVVGKYHYFIIALDAEELTVAQRKQKVLDHIATSNIILQAPCQLVLIIHNKCIETWFLGNRKVYKRNPQGEKFLAYTKHYNVATHDPESMPKMDSFRLTAHFHEAYLREMLKEQHISYRKSRPDEVLAPYYFEELLKRVDDLPEHLQSFSECIQLFEQIKVEMTQ